MASSFYKIGPVPQTCVVTALLKTARNALVSRKRNLWASIGSDIEGNGEPESEIKAGGEPGSREGEGDRKSVG